MGNVKIRKKAEIEANKKKTEIRELKKQLDETDYMIIKSIEYQILGIEIPYNLAELHTERQTIRDKINELEGLI